MTHHSPFAVAQSTATGNRLHWYFESLASAVLWAGYLMERDDTVAAVITTRAALDRSS